MAPDDDTDPTPHESATATAEEGAEERPRLALDVKIDKQGACQRHVTVVVPRQDIDRYYDTAYSKLMEKSAVPGFRPGRAPRKLVESRYRKEITEQIKGELILDALTQVTEEQKLAAISEPDLDPVAIEVPEEGAMTFEFDLEVRPEFDSPKWQGLKVERPTRDITEKDIDTRLQNILSQRGQLTPFDGPAEVGDYITANITMRHGEQELSKTAESVIRIRPVLSFRDGKIENFDKLMAGVRAGETRSGKARLTEDAPNPDLRGKEVEAAFEVLDVKKLRLPELTPELLQDLGEFESEQELRDAIRAALARQLSYHQQQRARQQVLSALTVAANWDLPPEMLQRQSRRELERAVLELRRSGFSEAEIRAHENELRQNSRESTARALKEHFILERIAEDEKIDISPEDYDDEIALIAEQSGESTRRVRAQLEKRGLMDALRNQIIERKTIEMILAQATFKDVPFKFETSEAEALDQSAGGEDEDAEIPEAKYAHTPTESSIPKDQD
jgi:trigger factor